MFNIKKADSDIDGQAKYDLLVEALPQDKKIIVKDLIKKSTSIYNQLEENNWTKNKTRENRKLLNEYYELKKKQYSICGTRKDKLFLFALKKTKCLY